MIVMPLVSGSGSLLITLTNQDRPLFAAAGLLFMVVSVGLGILLYVGTRSSARRKQRTDRECYLDYLEGMRRTAREAAGLQRTRSAVRQPDPAELVDLARLPARRWERRPGDADFLGVRVGTGTTPLARGLSIQLDRSDPLITYDPVCLSAAETLIDRYATLSDQPIVVSLTDVGYLSVVGERGAGRALARAMIGQLAAQHPPDDVRIGVVRAPALESHWEWVKWLPHAGNESAALGRRTGAGPSTDELLVAASVPELLSRMDADLDARKADAERRRGREPGKGLRRLVVVIDGEFQYGAPYLDTGSSDSPADLGIHLICLVAHRREEPEQIDLRVVLESPTSSTTSGKARDGIGAVIEGQSAHGGVELVRAVDDFELSAAAGLARSLCPLRLAEVDVSDVLSATVGLHDILGVSDVAELDPRQSWRPGSAREFLRVPVGVGAGGQPVHLDLKESAHGGMGPHGLVVGATGSGKSEMLRTMVTSLVIGHSPDRLALLLVDFKGGATFAGFAELPHMAGMVTNLAADPGLVQRFRDALFGELTRRQRMLADAGNLPNCQAYADLVDSNSDGSRLDPMPHLLVIIDEFTELLAARPDFAELFLAVGRIGRSIGVHLLLATQRLDAGKIRGLESHLSYRISLRTFSEIESREALGVPDAYHLPPEPGAGYLKVDTTVFERFKAALVSTPYQGPITEVGAVAPVVPFRTLTDLVPAPTCAGDLSALAVTMTDSASRPIPVPPSARPNAPTILDVAVARLAGAGAARVRQVWIRPLPRALALNAVPGGDASGDDHARVPGLGPPVSAVLGLRDIPAEQQQPPLTWDFSGPQGNLLVLGAALSGKSMLLRTLICSLALRYPPGEVALYCLDYGGGSIAGLEALPHVAGACTRADPDRVRRCVADILSMLDVRERLMSQHGWDGADGLRRARRLGILSGDVPGDVFLVIDGWAALREAEPDLEDQVMAIANRGPSLGVHTVLSASAPAQVRMRLATALPGRIELRLTDAFDSTIDRRLADAVPADVPGRALVRDGHLVQIALPRLDGATGLEDLPSAVEALAQEVCTRWPGPRVSQVRVLPAILKLSDLIDCPDRGQPLSGRSPAVPVGVTERDLGPVEVDLFGSDPHLQIYGEPQSGKSAFLRTLLSQLVGACTPDELGIVLVDYRRAHLDLVPSAHLLGYCTSAAATRQAVAQVCQGLAQRMPGPDVTSDQLRARTWWSGPEILVLVDDYDLVTGSVGNPLTPLTEYLPQGRDLGLHLVTARRTGGASRAMFESVTQALTDLAGPGLLFSGDRTEGRLVAGVASMRLPPGRALLARRGRPPEQVQVAWTDPA
ncbi:MAG: type VII secretion protein EccCa [Actinomycetota bacterium]|nr:type VII secretion protein EccCa [Actinomycetota bacterium]